MKKEEYSFVDNNNNLGSCIVYKPAERFDMIITRKVAENLLNKHGYALPFEIMRPWDEDDDWLGVDKDDLENGKLDKDWKQFEIWL